ncbi:uncharacterized protein LOC121857336 [Homarus americanus]|uniref:uncharacterized protein LOC121857336 n=1 Tax=Homarus americanus TaxID=6706 RepID=UPI001C43F555|nr:uncharacterized protein LOC121857336 [Homarus americanus]
MGGCGFEQVAGGSYGGGTPLSMLQLPPSAHAELSAHLRSVGSSGASFTLDGGRATDAGETAEHAEGEVGWVCKSCRLVFPSPALLAAHQRALDHTRGVLRLTQLLYACTSCRHHAATLADYRRHLDSEQHRAVSVPVSSASGPMVEDAEVAAVVQQITALAQAAHPSTDTNANINKDSAAATPGPQPASSQ